MTRRHVALRARRADGLAHGRRARRSASSMIIGPARGSCSAAASRPSGPTPLVQRRDARRRDAPAGRGDATTERVRARPATLRGAGPEDARDAPRAEARGERRARRAAACCAPATSTSPARTSTWVERLRGRRGVRARVGRARRAALTWGRFYGTPEALPRRRRGRGRAEPEAAWAEFEAAPRRGPRRAGASASELEKDELGARQPHAARARRRGRAQAPSCEHGQGESRRHRGGAGGAAPRSTRGPRAEIDAHRRREIERAAVGERAATPLRLRRPRTGSRADLAARRRSSAPTRANRLGFGEQARRLPLPLVGVPQRRAARGQQRGRRLPGDLRHRRDDADHVARWSCPSACSPRSTCASTRRQGSVVSTVRIAINNLAGVPSIVFGVFGLGFFCYIIGGRIDELFFPRVRCPTRPSARAASSGRR